MRGRAYSGPVLTLRRAAAADVDAVRAVTTAAFEKYVPRLGGLPAPMEADHAAAVHAGRVWVAEEDGTTLGYATLEPQPDHLLLDIVAVSPAAQGRGVGGRLLALAEERAREAGLPEIRLCTSEVMTENIAYYPRRGYTETHRGEEEGFKRVFFRKPVSPGEPPS